MFFKCKIKKAYYFDNTFGIGIVLCKILFLSHTSGLFYYVAYFISENSLNCTCVYEIQEFFHNLRRQVYSKSYDGLRASDEATISHFLNYSVAVYFVFTRQNIKTVIAKRLITCQKIISYAGLN